MKRRRAENGHQRGSILSNGTVLPTTFTLKPRRAINNPTPQGHTESSGSETLASDAHSDPRFQGKVLSMDNLEKNIFERFCRKPFDAESSTLIHSTLALTTYYFRTNCFKSFGDFNLQTVPHYKNLRRILIKLSSKHYGIAINNLRRTLLNLNDKNLVIAIISSSFLKKISIYEYQHMKTSIMFSKGLIGLFNDLLKKAVDNSSMIKSIEVAWLMNFLTHASKTKHYEPYNSSMLTEYLEFLDQFKAVLVNLQYSDMKVIFLFNHLYKYTERLFALLKDRTIQEINNDPKELYKLLRHWLLILPLTVHVREYLRDPILKTLLNLYQCFTRILDNLLPKVVFYFLQSFSGGLSLINDELKLHEYRVKLFDELGASYSKSHLQKESAMLTTINLYCYRLHSFFNMRTNIWVVLYDNERVVSDYAIQFMDKLQITSSALQKCLNEVPIKRFMGTVIDYNHYVHLPGTVRLSKNDENLKYLYSDRGRYLFDYNKHHYEDFLLGDSQKPSRVDPMLQFHLLNTRNVKSFITNEDEVEPEINYSMLFPRHIAKLVVDNLSVAYQNYFSDLYQEYVPDLVMKLNPNNGLLYDDRDPFLLDKDSKVYQLLSQCFTKLDDTKKLNSWLTNYYNERNQELSGCFDEGDDSEEEDFYDDLNEKYFKLW